MDCQIGSFINVKNGNVILENNTLSGSILPEEILIYGVNSSITLQSLYIANFHGAGFLEVHGGLANVTDVSFIHCISSFSLISASFETILVINNSTFISNYGCLIFAEKTSFGFVMNSVFDENIVLQMQHEIQPAWSLVMTAAFSLSMNQAFQITL